MTTPTTTSASGVELPLEFCALRYLLQWARKESHLHTNVRKSSPDRDDIRRALRYFQVSRSFVGIKDNDRADRVTAALLTVRSASIKDPQERVVRLAEKLKVNFQYNLSAASKLLWLSDRKGIIYDSRALQALKDEFGHTGAKTDYLKYCETWKQAYASKRGEVERAIQRLPAARKFLPSELESSKLQALVSKTWFKERVFDIYLWELGGEG